MQAVTEEEIQEILAQTPNLRCHGRNLHFDGPEAKSTNLSLKVFEPHQLVHLARLLAHLNYDEGHFAGAEFWITQSAVWNQQEEAVALKTLERMRQGYGENRALESAPAHLFRSDEFVESVSFLLQPMLIGWDAYYIPHWSWGSLDFFLFVSHDAFVRIETRTTQMKEKVTQKLGSYDWIKI
jgi:hypothetical protein